jgi:phage baseplate assembly protein V
MSERLMARVRGMVSRAVVGLVNDSLRLQGVQITLLADQVADDVERFQNYGFTSVPHAGAEAIALAVGGNTGHTVVLVVDDRRYRMGTLADGEVAIYDDLGHSVHLTRTGVVVNGNGDVVRITNTPLLRVEGSIEATGEIKDLADSGGAARTMAQMRTSHAAHTHTSAAPGSPTSVPIEPL